MEQYQIAKAGTSVGAGLHSALTEKTYLSNRKQRVKINSVYNIWKDISYGVPQGSILGPLLFNILSCDLFYFLENTDIASCADDNNLYSAQKNRETVINTIETSSNVLFDWFSDNFMKANSGKSHLLIVVQKQFMKMLMVPWLNLVKKKYCLA